jgi:hypothetical protein
MHTHVGSGLQSQKVIEVGEQENKSDGSSKDERTQKRLTKYLFFLFSLPTTLSIAITLKNKKLKSQIIR